MPLDSDKIDDALFALTLHDGYRAWKGFDWDAFGRLQPPPPTEKLPLAIPTGDDHVNRPRFTSTRSTRQMLALEMRTLRPGPTFPLQFTSWQNADTVCIHTWLRVSLVLLRNV